MIDPDLFWSSFLAGELITFLATCVCVFLIRRKNPELVGFTLQKPVSGLDIDMSVSGDGKDLGQMLDEIEEFLKKNNVPWSVSQKVRFFYEELMENISEYGLGRDPNRFIDVITRFTDTEFQQIIRDDGVFFDPIMYSGEGPGILLTKKMCSSIQYAQVMGQNTVTLTFTLPNTKSAGM